MGPYARFVVETLADLYGTTEADVLDRIVTAWAVDHQGHLTNVADLRAWQVERERRTAAAI